MSQDFYSKAAELTSQRRSFAVATVVRVEGSSRPIWARIQWASGKSLSSPSATRSKRASNPALTRLFSAAAFGDWDNLVSITFHETRCTLRPVHIPAHLTPGVFLF